jgi:hypothetical protein
MKKKPPVVVSKTVAVFPGPKVDGYLRNMEFPQGAEMLDADTRARMAERRRLHHNERVAAAERELAAQRARDDLRDAHRSGGKAGRQTKKVQHVWKIAIKSRARSAQWLFDNLGTYDKKIIGKMTFKSFETHVGKARKNNPSV